MAVGIGFVRNMMKNALVLSILLVMAGILAACGQSEEPTLAPGMTPDRQSTEEPVVSGRGRVITGEEALEFYGIDVDNPPTPGAETATRHRPNGSSPSEVGRPNDKLPGQIP